MAVRTSNERGFDISKMRAAVITHKECWTSPSSPTGHATIGGFPFQMRAISELFKDTTIICLVRQTPAPQGAEPLAGHNLQVRPLKEPPSVDWRRKVNLLWWLPRNIPRIWREIRQSDVVHALVPGDIGTIGILVALSQRKPLFIRHCGTWGQPVTAADGFLFWLLEKIAGRRNVVVATGGADNPPSHKNPDISWIFSTTLTEKDLNNIPVSKMWHAGEVLRLVTVGRLSSGKNTEAVIRALPLIREQYSKISLEVVGDGPCKKSLQKLTAEFNLDEMVTFHGNLSHQAVMRVLAGSHLFVFPTRVKEGFPKAVLEALACGLPVIATEVSVIPHIIEKHSGILLREPDQAAVAQAVLQLVFNEERYAAMASNARETSRQYTLEAWQDVIRKKLEDCWGGRSAGSSLVENSANP